MPEEEPRRRGPVRDPAPRAAAVNPHDKTREKIDQHLGASHRAPRAPARERPRALSYPPPVPPPAYDPEAAAHRHAPERPVVLVGGGRLGRLLMRRFPNAVILETDPAKIRRLREEFGAYRVYHGSGANEEHLRMAGLPDVQAVVMCTNVDETNYKGAKLARDAGVRNVISRLEYSEQAPRFRAIGAEPVAAPLSVCANMITNLISPERRTIGQGIIAEKAPTVGVRIGDLKMRRDAIIVSILRGDHLITPEPEERLRAGDVVTVMTERSDLAETLIQVTGRDLTLNPLDRLYVPIMAERGLRTVFREGFVLAEYADAELFVFAPEHLAEVALEAERLALQAGMKFQLRLFKRKGFLKDVITEVERQDTFEEHGGLADRLFFEAVLVEGHRGGFWQRLLRRRPVDRLLANLDHPILVARNQKPYRKILLVIDNAKRASMTVGITMDIALVYGSDITALLPESVADDEAFHLLRHLKRAGKIYGVDVVERIVRGNPTLEFIMEAKSGDYDLIVLDWQGRLVKRDILRRVIDYGPRSTLILP